MATFGDVLEAIKASNDSILAAIIASGTSSANIQGSLAHDAAISTQKPVTISGVASAASPAAVSADQDVVRLWALLNGALSTFMAYGLNITDDQARVYPTAASVTVRSTALEASHVLKSSAGKLMALWGWNDSVSAQYIQLHNTISVPADTAVPVDFIWAPPKAHFAWMGPALTGADFSTGITVVNSSTQLTKTLGSADCWFNAVVLA